MMKASENKIKKLKIRINEPIGKQSKILQKNETNGSIGILKAI